MMPTIRIDDDVYARLKKMAEPFEDSPNDVIRRLLDGGPRPIALVEATKKAAGGRASAYAAYRIPILKALVDLTGRAKTADVLKRVKRAMEATLNAHDRERLETGMIRWQNHAQWERLSMVQNGLLEKNSPHGVWEITTEGRNYLRDQGHAAVMERRKALLDVPELPHSPRPL